MVGKLEFGDLKMRYDEFMSKIKQYYVLYQKGLKKQANSYIKDYLAEFKSSVCQEEYNSIFFDLCKEICNSKEKHWMMIRGNGSLPFELNNCVRDYLYVECEKNKMPHLRWFYQLYHNDRIGCIDAEKMIRRAYQHKECDTNTVELFMDFWLDILAWGAHHFPDGCIIEKETYQSAIKECEKIIDEKEVNKAQCTKLKYYKRLYCCWEKFIEEKRTRDFEDYCKDANIYFEGIKAYYYNR